MEIKRTRYLEQLIRKRENGLVKVVTGVRRCGKSYLLNNIYYNYLRAEGVAEDHIIMLALDDDENIRYRNPLELGAYLRGLLTDDGMHYIFIDEIQECREIENPYLPGDKVTFTETLLGLMKKKNADVYVTGSNSRMLSEDILTEFRGKGDEIRVNPLSYKEFYDAYEGDRSSAWNEYMTYGGMPFVMSLTTHKDKMDYLNGLFNKIYFSDIINRHQLSEKQLPVLEALINIASSSIGSLTNPSNYEKMIKDRLKVKTSDDTIRKYLEYFKNAFLISEARRYDIKGKEYIGSPYKYYFTDLGLRNARINFRQMEETHIMENIIYNELMLRGYSVDVGYMELNERKDGKNVRVMKEVDFVVSTSGSRRYYIQSAYKMETEEKRENELKVFTAIKDSFRKIIIEKDVLMPWYDDNGILHIGVEQFLLDESAMDL